MSKSTLEEFNINFSVTENDFENDRGVYLHFGNRFRVRVCDDPEEFEFFVQELTDHLYTINEEMRSIYCIPF